MESQTSTPEVVAYCMRCREKRVMLQPTEMRMKNGRLAVTGTCTTCGGKVFKVGSLTQAADKGADKAEKGEAAPEA